MDEIFAKPGWPIVPPLSNRTLHHPSFLPVYMAAAPTHYSMDWHQHAEVPLITPFQFFYNDDGRRIHNSVTDLRVFECFRLNTPPPVMSPLIAPPSRPDPFMASPHPTRNLGSPRWRAPVGASLLPARGVIQLSREEDQAITTLLKLHYRDPSPGVHLHHCDHPGVTGEAPVEDMDTELSPPAVATLSPSAAVGDEQRVQVAILESERCRARFWSNAELEAANTLLTLLSLMDEFWPQNQKWSRCRRSIRSPGNLQNLLEEGQSPEDADSQPAPDVGPSLISTHVCNWESTQTYVANGNFDWLVAGSRFDTVDRRPLGGDGVSCEGQVTSTTPTAPGSSHPEVEWVYGGMFGVREGTLAESEGAAVHALLSLGGPMGGWAHGHQEFPAAGSIFIDVLL